MLYEILLEMFLMFIAACPDPENLLGGIQGIFKFPGGTKHLFGYFTM